MREASGVLKRILGLFLFKWSPREFASRDPAKENVNPFGGAVHFHHTSRCYCANGIANKIFQIADNTGRYREMVICLISDASSSNIRPPPRYVFPTDERDDNVYNGGRTNGGDPAFRQFLYMRIQFSYMISWNISVRVSTIRNKCIQCNCPRVLHFITIHHGNIINPGNISIPWNTIVRNRFYNDRR